METTDILDSTHIMSFIPEKVWKPQINRIVVCLNTFFFVCYDVAVVKILI